MKAYVTSVGEPTEALCVWALERQGFDVTLVRNDSNLWGKLKLIYSLATDDFVRVDADVIVNQNLHPEKLRQNIGSDEWWVQFMTYDWYKQDLTHGGVQFIKKEALEALRSNVAGATHKERPESYMFRLAEFHNPRRCVSSEEVMGLHGYKNDMIRARIVKERRSQVGYDWELVSKLEEL
jgi:hypothetical protein